MSASADPQVTIATTEVRGTKAQRADALHDLSIAHVELGHLDEAATLAEDGLRLSGQARFHLTLAWIDLDRGRRKQSLRHLDLATPHLRGRELARARCLRGLHLCQAAEPRLAIAELTSVIKELRRHGDERWLANALIGRGIARCHAMKLTGADADFTSARTVLLAIGEPGRAAMCLHNKGFVAMLAGNLPVALRLYEEAARSGLDSTSRPEALIDRAEALLAAGLDADALRVLDPAIDLLQRCNRGSLLPDALLLGARCALRNGDTGLALELYRRSGRTDPELMLAAGEVDAVAAHRLRGPAQVRALGWLAQARRSDRRGALAAIRAGLRVLDDNQVALSGGWPRRELTGAALDLARTPREVLHWSEEHRMTYQPPLPPRDSALATALTALRRGRALGGSVETLERDVRRLALASPQRAQAGGVMPDLPIVSFVFHKGRMLSVTVVRGRARLREIPEPAALVREARLALTAGRPLPRRDSLLPDEDEIVVIPDGILHSMPWAAFGGRIHVIPSLRHWRTPATPGGNVWITGPRLLHSEVPTLRREHGGRLSKSNVDAAMRALEGAGVAHVAAHGEAHPNNPLFSFLELGDGPLYGYDIARIENPPEVVVLSACESGLARAFLDAGTKAVIASVLPVPDARVGSAMAEVHRHIGHPVEAAAKVAHLGFSCYGTGTRAAACRAAAKEVPVQRD